METLNFFDNKKETLAIKISKIEINSDNTKEKYKSMKDELVYLLINLLCNLCLLEEEIFVRNQKMEDDKLKAGIPTNQTAPGFKELWLEYQERYKKFIIPVCTSDLIKRGYAKSIGNPAKYAYLNNECKIYFIMKSKSRAVIEIYFFYGINQKNQFVIKKIDDSWKLSEVRYGFANKTNWYIDHI